MSGTNAQLLVQDHQPRMPERTISGPGAFLLVLSAKSRSSLEANAGALADALDRNPELAADLSVVSQTLFAGRAHFRHRCALVVESAEEAAQQLRKLAGGQSDDLATGLVQRNFEPEAGVLSQVNVIHADLASADGTGSVRATYGQLAGFYCLGYTEAADVNPKGTPRLHLPGYEFSRTEYWAEADLSAPQARGEPLVGDPEFQLSETNFYEPVWTAAEDVQSLAGDVPRTARDESETEFQLWCYGQGAADLAADRFFTCDAEDMHTRFTSVTAQILESIKSLVSAPRKKRLLVQLVLCGEDAAAFARGCSASLQTVSQEFSFFRGQVIELASPLPAHRLRILLERDRKRESDTSIRYDNSIRRVLDWRKCDAPPTGFAWRKDGVYLITGGAGGIGRRMAKGILAEVPSARVVLCARSDKHQIDLTEFAGASSQPDYLTADITDGGSVDRLIKYVLQKYGALHGILHCAGLNEDGFITDKSEETLRKVLKPKVDGAALLDRATKDVALDFFVLFSSTSAVFGNAGQIDYAAANGFLDGFAGVREEHVKLGVRHGRTVSINWPLWKDGGMGVSDEREKVLRERFGLVPLDMRTGFAAMVRALSMVPAQVMVMQTEGGRDPDLSPRTEILTTAQPAAGVEPTLFVAILREVLMLGSEHDVDAHMTFQELGLDSIRGTRFIQDLSKRFGVELRETLVFDYPTLHELAAHLSSLSASTALSVGDDAREDNERGDSERGFQPPQDLELAKTIIALEDRHPEVFPLTRAQTNLPTLFCIHPMSGDVGVYVGLAEAAQGRFNIVGLRSQGLFDAGDPRQSVEAMAEAYQRIIREIIPEGPWNLLGSSMGGTVAFATLGLLAERTDATNRLFLLEAPLIDDEAAGEPWQSDALGNLLMNANFLMISMLHLDPDFRRDKAAGKIDWRELEITSDELSLDDESDKSLIVDQLVDLISDRGVTRQNDELTDRLTSMARVHLANLDALRSYRAPAGTPKSNISAVLLRSPTGRAVSSEVYNPDYLRQVQDTKGGLLPYFEGWESRFENLQTVVLNSESHFDLLSGGNDLANLVDRIDASFGAFGPAGCPETPHGLAREEISESAIAVIGMSGRFPGADTLDDLFDLLNGEKSAITPLPQDRGWDIGDCPVKHGGFLKDIDQFDPKFFRIPPKEAELLDPSERAFLMEGWRAVESAGIDPGSLKGENWGVYCGGGGDYGLYLKDLIGVSPNVTNSSIPGRLAYSLDLKGPCIAVDAGCASSALAVAQACDALVLDKCDVAIAGGVMIHSTPNLILASIESGTLSQDDRCFALDERASGMLPAEGVGAVVLKPFAKACEDGDRIIGVIEAWGNNHSGKTNGIAAPSSTAQAKLIRDVYARFGTDPAFIGLIEANATGTSLGDSVEVEALARIFSDRKSEASPVVLGSVENHLGHSYQSSGMAHLFKVLLSLQNEAIPGTLNVAHPLETDEAGNSRFVVNDRPVDWKRGGALPRRAAISSFGATGSNVHLVLSEAPSDFACARTPLPPQAFALRRCWFERPASGTGASPETDSGGTDNVLTIVTSCLADISGFDTEDIDSKDSLSQYGLDSLMAMRLLAQLNDRFSLTLHIADLVSVESIDDLVRLIRASRGQTSAALSPAPVSAGQVDQEILISDSWFAGRLASLPDELCFVNSSLASALRSDRVENIGMLSELAERGIGAFRQGAHVVLVGHRSSDVSAATAHIDDALLAALPEECLVLPVSDEQKRNLYHSEIMKSAAWNVSYIETLPDASLDRDTLVNALAKLSDRHDILRTRFVPLETGEDCLQVIAPTANAAPKITEAGSAQEFNRLMQDARLALFDVESSAPFSLVFCQSDGKCEIGFTFHHAIADAFTPPLLVRELVALYEVETASADDIEEEAPIGQYWHYALSQWSRQPVAGQDAFWRQRLGQVQGVAMRLPYSRSPKEVKASEWDQSETYLTQLAPDLCQRIAEFSRQQGISFTQLFAAALSVLLKYGMNNPQGVLHYIFSRRERSAYLDIPGEFTNVLMLPINVEKDRSLIDFLKAVKRDSFEALRNAPNNLDHLLSTAGLSGLSEYFRNSGDVMLDTIDMDTGTAGPSEGSPDQYGRIGEGMRMNGDGNSPDAVGSAVATLFFQLIKSQGRIHLVTSYRSALFDQSELRHLTAYLVGLVSYMLRKPDATIGDMLNDASEPLSRLREWTDRHAEKADPQIQKNAVSSEREQNPAPYFTECQRVNGVKDGRPVFWVHGAFGDAMVFLRLAERIERPFFGLQARGLIDDKEPIEGVVETASFYRQMIQAIQPTGPYDLGGYSIGGTLAYEIARQLLDAGETVQSLTLSDPIFPPHHSHLGGGLHDLYDFLAVGLLAMAPARDALQVQEKPDRTGPGDEAYVLEAFVEYCVKSGVERSAEWIRQYLKRMAAIQKSYRIAEYEPAPLASEIPHVRYFKNRNGLFLGQPGDPLEGVDYWSDWRSLLPSIGYQEVEADSHLALFESDDAMKALSEYCRSLYGNPEDREASAGLLEQRPDMASAAEPDRIVLRDVIGMVSRLLDRDRDEIDPAQDLVEQGLDSILMTQLLVQLRDRFHLDLDLAAMATLRSVEMIVEAVRSRGESSAAYGPSSQPRQDPIRQFPEIVHLNSGSLSINSGRPVFWFHGGLGGVEAYQQLAGAIERPFVGIQAKGWLTDRKPLNGIEAMATYYTHIIQRLQPSGPYDLGGFSLGGVLAYEVTRQLQEMGEQVDTIVMLDSYDVLDTEPNPLFTKRAMLGVVNMALQNSAGAAVTNMIHRDELDVSLSDQAFWEHLITLANARGLAKSEAQLRSLLGHMEKFGRALEQDAFTISPLPDPKGVSGHFFRNASGTFYGDIAPFFTFPESESVFRDGMNYWSAWEENLPNLVIQDVPSANHTTLLSDPAVAKIIIAYCRDLYDGRQGGDGRQDGQTGAKPTASADSELDAHLMPS
nr:SDR family NAD(P)-dependent oxidoreductase [Nisaea nitritireducens]